MFDLLDQSVYVNAGEFFSWARCLESRDSSFRPGDGLGHRRLRCSKCGGPGLKACRCLTDLGTNDAHLKEVLRPRPGDDVSEITRPVVEQLNSANLAVLRRSHKLARQLA